MDYKKLLTYCAFFNVILNLVTITKINCLLSKIIKKQFIIFILAYSFIVIQSTKNNFVYKSDFI